MANCIVLLVVLLMSALPLTLITRGLRTHDRFQTGLGVAVALLLVFLVVVFAYVAITGG